MVSCNTASGIFFISTMGLFALSLAAALHKVGDSDAWTTLVPVDYAKWASSNTFHVGDYLLFSYNNKFHNVVQVNQQQYESCNASSPAASYSSGADSIALKLPGTFYFLCGFPGHCQAGQKVQIKVTTPPSSSSSSSSSSSTLAPFSSKAPNPSPLPFGPAPVGLLLLPSQPPPPPLSNSTIFTTTSCRWLLMLLHFTVCMFESEIEWLHVGIDCVRALFQSTTIDSLLFNIRRWINVI